MGLDIKSGDDNLWQHLTLSGPWLYIPGIGRSKRKGVTQKYWNNNVEGTKRIMEHYLMQEYL